MERMKQIKDHIENCVLENMEIANTKELGEAVDMIKDMAMSMYYCQLVEAMSEKKYGIDYDENGVLTAWDKMEKYYGMLKGIVPELNPEERVQARQKIVALSNMV